MIRLKESLFEEYCNTFDQMDYRADDYCPTKEEIEEEIIPNLEKYLPFILWIDETGFDTEKNRSNRKIINDLLKNNMEICEEEEI